MRKKNAMVNGISPGFVPTYSLSKIGNSLEMLETEKQEILFFNIPT